MTLLEGTIVLAIMGGITLTTVEMTQEVESQYQIYQQQQHDYISMARKYGFRPVKEADND